jgi:predicted Zn finger-like uncharacterized protein
MPKVFISHSTKDRLLVEREIIDLLNSHGIETWYSKDDIRTAEHFEKMIRQGLEACDWFLVAISPNAINSEWVRDEVHWALEERPGKVIPVLIGDCKPRDLHIRMGRIQQVDLLRDPNAKSRLLATWGIHLKPVDAPKADSRSEPATAAEGKDTSGKVATSADAAKFTTISCPQCGAKLRVPADLSPSDRVRCPRCKTALKIPSTRPEATPGKTDTSGPTARKKSYALISDIHSNLEALQAVLTEIGRQGVERVYCLGDVLGYGPNPCECVELMRRYPVVLLGDHDQAAMFDPEGFEPAAERAIFWARAQLEGHSDAEGLWGFLAERPRSHREDGLLFVHASPRNPMNEDVMPEDIYNERKMERLFDLVERSCFQGHTHVPGIFTEDRQFYSPEEVNHVYQLGKQKVMCNVGSVGQPRDGDWRACYAILEGNLVRFYRVEYDIETTIRKINAVPELDSSLGQCLRIASAPG